MFLVVVLLPTRGSTRVIAPRLAGIRTPRRGRPPATWPRIDRDYEALRVDMHALFQDLGLTTAPAAA